MKRLLTATAALCILAGPMATLAPATALAQEHHDEHGGGHPPAGGGGHPSAPAAPQAHAAPAGAPAGGAPGGYRPQGGAPGAPGGGYRPPTSAPVAPGGGYRPQGYQGQGGYPQQARPGFQGQPGYRGEPQGGYSQGGRPGFQGQPGFRGGDPGGPRGPRPGAQAFQTGGRTFYRYRTSPYAFPPAYRGWDHHYWRRGEFLPSVFFLPNYYIDDYWSYGLWAPDYGYQWIRVGADALLINLSTGEVVDAVPGVYYW